jgi:hypothetical protein
MKNVLGLADILTGFKQNRGVVRGNGKGVLMLSASISGPDGEIPIWLFHHDRSLAPIRRAIGDAQKSIRQGKFSKEFLKENVPSIDLAAEIAGSACGEISASFFDFKTPEGRLSFAFLVGRGYTVDIEDKQAPEALRTILDYFTQSAGGD